VVQPADLAAAKRWYQQAEADPNWKQIAARKLAVAGSWCPGRSN
jgi:hypothetical protein